MDFVQGEGTILKSTISHAGDDASARHRGVGGKLKATSTGFVADEAPFVKKSRSPEGFNSSESTVSKPMSWRISSRPELKWIVVALWLAGSIRKAFMRSGFPLEA